MSTELIKLYNTLALIETKGEGTKLMAQCLAFVEQLANEARANEMKEQEKVDSSSEKKVAKNKEDKK